MGDEKVRSREKTWKDALRKCYLCRNLSEEELDRLMGSPFFRGRVYAKGEQVFREMDVPEEIMILASGLLVIAKDTLNGRRMIISRVSEVGDTFGEVYVFKKLPSYDMYTETLEKSTVLFVHRDLMDKEQEGPMRELAEKMMRNQLGMFANKAYQMSRRLRILGSASIREKIARLLIERQGNSNRVQVMARENMADYLNVTRPSLSREISNMCKEGIIRSEGRTLVILDQDRLEEYI